MDMRWLNYCLSAVVGSTMFLSACTGCSQSNSPDDIQRQTANATAKLKQDTVAVAKGVKQGLTKPKTVDINSASKDELVGTLGVTDPVAEKIIAARPYDNADQLVTKRAVSTAEYDRIKDKVAVKK